MGISTYRALFCTCMEIIPETFMGTSTRYVYVISTRCMYGKWQHLPGTWAVYLPGACMATSARSISSRCMYGNIYQAHIYHMHVCNIYQVHFYQMHVWEQLPGTFLQDVCMGTSTRYTYTRCMYGNNYQVHFYKMYVWEHLPGTHIPDACIGTSTVPCTHLPDACMGTSTRYSTHLPDACMGTSTRYTSTRWEQVLY
jgi:hypothetical protein